jgi:hypothetical protein
MHYTYLIFLLDFLQVLYGARGFSKKINIFLSIHNFLQFIYYRNIIYVLVIILGRN